MELIRCLISRNSMTFNCNVSHLIIEAMIPCQAPTWLQILVVRCIHILGFVYLTNANVIHVISAQSSLFNPSCTKFSCIKCIALSKPPTYKLSNKLFGYQLRHLNLFYTLGLDFIHKTMQSHRLKQQLDNWLCQLC